MGVILDVIQGIGGLFNSLVQPIIGFQSLGETRRHNEINENIANNQNALQQEAFDFNKNQTLQEFEYNKWLNQEQMSREDNAIQRRVADLRAAGLSPLLAAGQSAAASAGSPLSANQISGPDLQSVDFKNGYGALQSGLQNTYEGILQGIKTYKDSQLANAQIDNIASQTEKNQAEANEKNLSNQYLEQKLVDEATIRTKDIENRIQALENAQKTSRNLSIDYEIKKLEKEKRIYENQIAKHDWNLINDSPLASPIVLSGARSNIGRTVQDILQMLGLSNGNTINNDGNGNFVSTGSAIEQDPSPVRAVDLFDKAVNKINELNPFNTAHVNPDGSISKGKVDFDLFNGAFVDGRKIKNFKVLQALELDKQGKSIPNSWFVEPVESKNRFNGYSHSNGYKNGYSGRSGRF